MTNKLRVGLCSKLIAYLLPCMLVCCKTDQKPATPTSGEQHPFYHLVSNVNTDPKSGGISKPSAEIVFQEAKDVRPIAMKVKLGEHVISLTLEATPEVPKIALQTLEANLKATYGSIESRPELQAFYSTAGKLMQGEPEVRLPQSRDQNRMMLFLTWPDGWEMVRPNVIRWRKDYVPYKEKTKVVSVTQALTGSWTEVRGVLRSQPPGGTAQPLGFIKVTINGMSTRADAAGNFTITGSFTSVDQLTIDFDGTIDPLPGQSLAPKFSVVDDLLNTRSEDVDVPNGTTSGSTLDVGPLALNSLDAELFQVGGVVLTAFHQMTGRFPPSSDGYRIKRWAGIHSGTPHSYYDYTAIALNFRDWKPSQDGRRSTLWHEFGHTLAHAAQGNLGYWQWNNFRWAYGRNHNGTEVLNEQFAFNEGWANYWRCTNPAFAGRCTSIPGNVPSVSFLDWNETRVGERLFQMANVPGVGHPAMFDILLSNPGIFTFWDFERKYCERFPGGPFCTGSIPTRKKDNCPPSYLDDGATCRLNNILAKDSYTRGAGTVPPGCGSEKDAGLCYEPCAAGYDGVGPVCWRQCPAGMTDDGAFCRRDADIIGANNDRCPWYDKCGLVSAKGCSTCPPGYRNDGCTCRIDAWIFAKDTYTRGAGIPPTDCGAGREYDAGLCYQPCRPGYSGVGPVCWGQCPPGYDDHGATCYRSPSILVKF